MRLRRPSSVELWQVLIVLCVAGFVLVLANSGCSSGAICYRNTDCPVGFECDHGQCLHLSPTGDAAVIGDAAAGASNAPGP